MRLASLILILFLSACDHLLIEPKEYTQLPPTNPKAQKCATQCVTTQGRCHRSCEALKNSCQHKAEYAAQQNYLNYVHERMKEGLLVDKKESDFAINLNNCPDTQRCKTGCDVNQRNCHGTCGGEVQLNGKCISNCDTSPPKSALRDVADWFSETPEE